MKLEHRADTLNDIPEKVIAFCREFPEAMWNLANMVEVGAKKHGPKTYLDKDNPSMEHKNNHASLSRHLADHYVGVPDPETGDDPLGFLSLRSIMKYTRKVRGIDE